MLRWNPHPINIIHDQNEQKCINVHSFMTEDKHTWVELFTLLIQYMYQTMSIHDQN